MLYRICLETGDNGGDATGTIDSKILGHIFAAPYAYFEPKHCHLLCLEGRVCGYILGTSNSIRFKYSCEKHWWPQLRKEYPLPEILDGSTETKMITMIHEGLNCPYVVNQYPAHLHIDLLPQAQGKGFGYKLIEKFCQGLINQGIQGVHLGVGRANTRACLFYQKCGFTVLEENEQEFIYGKKLF